MHYQLTQTDCTFFSKNRHLLFKEFYTQDELNHLNKNDIRFDVAKTDPRAKKLLVQKLFGQLTSQLTKKSHIRFLFDMLINSSIKHTNIEQLTPFSDVTMGILIPLMLDSNKQDAISLFEEEPQDILFIHPTHDLFCSDTPHKHLYRLIVLGDLSSRYQIKSTAAYSPVPKMIGHSSGDTLDNKDFPLLTR